MLYYVCCIEIFDFLASSTDDSESDDKSEYEQSRHYVRKEPANTKKKKQFITGDLVSKFDGLGMSDYQAVRITGAIAKALGHNVDDLAFSRSTIYRARGKNRKETADRIKNTFKVK